MYCHYGRTLSFYGILYMEPHLVCTNLLLDCNLSISSNRHFSWLKNILYPSL
ncbi:hypothetical protein MCHI_001948 [Candidatus Magnetoovum chiemensis]|nr:hypothetical protein MCHI_001948 [Candidatus Magnetoovum chiemensis]